VPLPDEGFDLAISEYGASLWADPYRWVPEAARLLRPGGPLIFLTNSLLTYLCVPDTDAEGPATDRLRRTQFGMYRMKWPEDPSVDFHLPHGEWIRLLRSHEFEIEELTELRPPETSETSYPWMSLEWARQWPCEEVWKARKRGRGAAR
jgi:SAM-dependent methyltransferase